MKRITNLLLSGLMLSAISVSAQPTITQDWKNTTGIPTYTEARYGVGFNGKIYTNDKTAKTLYAFDGTSRETVVTPSASAVGVSVDAVGNVIMLDGWAGAGAMKTLKVWNHATGEVVAIPITVPDGVTAARMDFIGRTAGDVFSEEGAAIFFAGEKNTSVAKIFLANGAQVDEKSKSFATGVTFTTDAIAVPLTADPESDEFAFRNRGNKDFYHYNGSKWVPYTRVGNINSTSGGDVFTLGGVLYTVEPAGTNYKDGFQVVSRGTNEVIATHEAEANAHSGYPTSLSAEVMDAKTVRIYQFHLGDFAAQYTIEFPVVYLVGNMEGAGNWSPTTGLEAVWTSADVYEADFTALPGNNFKIATKLGDWDTVNSNCFGFAINNSNAAVGENDIVAGPGAISIAEGGDYHIKIDIANKKMTLTKKPFTVYPERFYVFGNIKDHSWKPNYDGAVLEATETVGVYKSTDKVTFDNGEYDSYFALTTAIGKTDNDFGSVNPLRWGPAAAEVTLTNTGTENNFLATDNTFGYYGAEHNYVVANGSYDIEVDINAGTIKLSNDTPSGVGKVAAAKAKAVGLNGEIRIIDGTTASIYNAAGQAIVVGTASKTVSVAPGMYVVVVDGTAQKVVVR